jgi:beta-glucosidase
LVGWSKVKLKAGESRDVTVAIDPQYLTIFEEATNSWKQVPGQYTFAVGGSSKDLPLKQQVALQ